MVKILPKGKQMREICLAGISSNARVYHNTFCEAHLI